MKASVATAHLVRSLGPKRVVMCFVHLLIVCLFLMAALEGMLRVTFSDPEYYWDNRFTFLSPESFQNHGEGVWTYRANRTIREVSLYAFPTPFGRDASISVEYDCLMRSNNLGLLQGRDVTPGSVATIIAGDSFTAGQGGCPWFDRLQPLRGDENLVNAGLVGTGFDQWNRLLTYLSEQHGIKAKRLLMIAISNDFKRTARNWSQTELNCFDHDICEAGEEPSAISLYDSHEVLIKRTEARLATRFNGQTYSQVTSSYLRRNSYLYKIVTRAAWKAVELVRAGGKTYSMIPVEIEKALESIKSLGIPVHVLMVPQRDEVGILSDQTDLQSGITLLEAHGVSHSWCPLSAPDFLPNDGHPNRAGYDKLVACVDATLSTMK